MDYNQYKEAMLGKYQEILCEPEYLVVIHVEYQWINLFTLVIVLTS